MKLFELNPKDYSEAELREMRRMKQAFSRGDDLTSNMVRNIRALGLRHAIQAVEREADLNRKNKSSAEVVLSFLAGLTVGAFKAGHRFIFPSLPRTIDVPPEAPRRKANR